MNPAQFRIHIEAYLNLRSSSGFRTVTNPTICGNCRST